MDIKLDFNDIMIKPAVISNINSRSEVNPYYENGNLPIFTAPMDTVVDSNNYNHFIDNKINVVLPRGVEPIVKTQDFLWESISLDDFIKTYVDNKLTFNKKRYLLIDIANGHMVKLHKAIENAKDYYGDSLIIMAGNVANSETYEILSNSGADYVRVSVGTGNACLTSVQTGVGYGIASLISECFKISHNLNKPAKIVADGGMKQYSDIIKAIALGADYVMVGGLFNKCIESCGETYYKEKNSNFVPISYSEGINHYKNGDLGDGDVYKKFRGMSTKEVQKKWGKNKITTSEGIVKYNKVEYSISDWVDNFTDYLKSAMSYSNAKNLEYFKNYSELVNISENAFKRYNK
jgi:IMP dehydrogenase/GMP reductase